MQYPKKTQNFVAGHLLAIHLIDGRSRRWPITRFRSCRSVFGMVFGHHWHHPNADAVNEANANDPPARSWCIRSRHRYFLRQVINVFCLRTESIVCNLSVFAMPNIFIYFMALWYWVHKLLMQITRNRFTYWWSIYLICCGQIWFKSKWFQQRSLWIISTILCVIQITIVYVNGKMCVRMIK